MADPSNVESVDRIYATRKWMHPFATFVADKPELDSHHNYAFRFRRVAVAGSVLPSSRSQSYNSKALFNTE